MSPKAKQFFFKTVVYLVLFFRTIKYYNKKTINYYSNKLNVHLSKLLHSIEIELFSYEVMVIYLIF